MEQMGDTMGMLDLMIRPAFCVRDGVIVRVNQAAKGYLLEAGGELAPLLATGQQEYAEFSGSCLYLTLTIAGEKFGASVTRMEGFDVFVLEEEADRAELRTMALAAQELRASLSSVMTTVDRLFPMISQNETPAMQEQTAWINRGLFQMLRVISNMSDADRYCGAAPRLEARDVSALLSEIFQQATDLAAYAGISVEYTGLSAPVYCQVDPEKLERAVFNILSNAMKFTPRGGRIQATLSRRGSMLYLTVQDNGSGIPEHMRSSVFSRFRRNPSLEDGRFGIGLGMVLIRAAATAHGGTVLIEQPKDGGTRITMTLDIRKPGGTRLKSPTLRVDYAGERDHGLIELSEVLLHTLYENERFF